MHTERIDFLGVQFDRLTMNDVLGRLAQVSPETPYAFLVTPNVDHVVRLNREGSRSGLTAAYKSADLSICDSRVLKLLAKSHDIDLPLVAGSDLTVRVLNDVVRPGDKIAVIGGSDALVCDLEKRYPGVLFCHHEPPMGLRTNAAARQAAVEFIANTKARFTFLAVGSPQQEMIAVEARRHPEARGTALCIGASLDFITGRQRRAPKLMQRLSLEWAYRLLSDPRRMWRRYLVEGPRVFILAARYREPRT